MIKPEVARMNRINKRLFKVGQRLIKNSQKIEGQTARVLTIQGNAMRNYIIESMKNTTKEPYFYRSGAGRKIKHYPSKPNNPPAINTGELVRSILYSVSKFKLEVGVAGGGVYGKWLEDGTKDGRIKARPFIKPAAIVFEEEIFNALGKEIEDLTTKVE